ncbi:unnamed protein product [Echinostoma caproni]|uniref:FK506-binding protein 4-like n=1 Tax=Echinostoma caproni TaxID=27848 RepID=A0A183ADG3_9TREM|nr:unnamed protein product [Echinostoma caproni]
MKCEDFSHRREEAPVTPLLRPSSGGFLPGKLPLTVFICWSGLLGRVWIEEGSQEVPKQLAFIYDRDANGITSYFGRFFNIEESDLPKSLSDIERVAFVDVEVKAPGYPSKQSSRQKSRLTAREILLGATSYRPSSSDDDDDEEEDENENSEHSEAVQESTDVESEESDEEDSSASEVSMGAVERSEVCDPNTNKNESEDNVKKLTKKVKKVKVSDEKSTIGIITAAEIRAKHRRERRQQEQINFQQQVRRSARAKLKRQGRSSLKAELTLFG